MEYDANPDHASKAFLCKCGHMKGRHKNNADHEEECMECQPTAPCFEFRSADESLRLDPGKPPVGSHR